MARTKRVGRKVSRAMGKSKHMMKSKAAKMSLRKKRGTRKAKTKGGSRQPGGKKKSKKGAKKHYIGHGGMDGATPLATPPPSPAASEPEEPAEQPGYLAQAQSMASRAMEAAGNFIQRFRKPAKKPELSKFEEDKLAIMGSPAYQNKKLEAELFEQHNVPMNAKLYK